MNNADYNWLGSNEGAVVSSSPRLGGLRARLTSTRTYARALSVLAALVVASCVTPARADEPPEELPDSSEPAPASAAAACAPTAGKSTKELVDEGKGYARDENWACSREFLRHAYTKQESYDIAGNVGIVTHELAKQTNEAALYAEAATYLTAALRAFPVSGLDEQRASLQERETACRARSVALSLKLTPASACVVIGTRDVGCGPFSYDLFAAPGTVVLQVKAPGHQSAEKTIANATAGSSHALTIDLSMQAATVTPKPANGEDVPTASSSAFPLWPTFIAGGLAVVAVGIGGGMWAAGDAEAADAAELRERKAAEVNNENFCAPPVESNVDGTCAELDTLAARHDEFKGAAQALFIGGGVLAIGAGAMLTAHLLSDGDEPATGFFIAPVFDGRGGMGFVAEGRW